MAGKRIFLLLCLAVMNIIGIDGLATGDVSAVVESEPGKRHSPGYTDGFGKCFTCPTPSPGPRGPPGPEGKPGREGRDGRDGRDSNIYVPIDDPEDPPNEPPKAFNGSLPGVPYTRWGKSTCPEGAELVYGGTMAGTHYGHKGGGANHLCLPNEPTFDSDRTGILTSGYVYGVEYETNLPNSPAILNSEAPCAVCLAKGRQSVLMIPGTNACFGEGWTSEYHGYIMAPHITLDYKTEHVCVDAAAEGIPRTSYSNNNAKLYVVTPACGSSGGGLPCPPYAGGHPLLCAVCTI